MSRHIWLRSANSTETDLRVAATSSAVPTATICWSFDRAEHKKRAVDKDDGAFCAAGPEKSSGDCYFAICPV